MQLTNQIHFRNVRGDLFGGVTAAVIALPMALAFGVASGAGAVAGLWGAVLVGFFAALFGGTPTLISEPTGQTRRRLENLKVLSLLPPNHLFDNREEALRYAAAVVTPGREEQPVDYGAAPAFT